MVGCSARIFPEFNLVRHISSKPAMMDRRRLGLVSCDHSDIVAQPFAISPCSLFPPWFPDPIFPCQSRCPRYKKNVRLSISQDLIPCPTAPPFLTSRRAEIDPTLLVLDSSVLYAHLRGLAPLTAVQRTRSITCMQRQARNGNVMSSSSSALPFNTICQGLDVFREIRYRM